MPFGKIFKGIKKIGSSVGKIGGLVGGPFGLSTYGKVAGAFGLGGTGAVQGRSPRHNIQSLIQGYRDAGLHGILAAGGGGGFSSMDSANALGDLGATVSDYYRNRDAKSAARSQARLNEKQMALIDAEILESRSRTLLNETNAKRALVGPRQPFGNGTHGGLENRPTVLEPHRDQPWAQTIEGPGGHRSIGPNPDAFEIGLSELLAGGLIHGSQWLYQALDAELERDKRTTIDKKREQYQRSFN